MSWFFQRKTIWLPTPLGLVLLLAGLGSAIAFWLIDGERILCQTDPVPADVLVVDGWIGRPGLHSAKLEFDRGGYKYVVTAGGDSTNDWDGHRWNYAVAARNALVQEGVPESSVLAAPAVDVAERRTFESAVAVRRILERNGLRPRALNVMTLGAHARRSRLIYAKVFDSDTRVGVISWIPPYYPPGPWWKSSLRSLELLKESVGYFLELVFNSGRASNHPKEATVPGGG